MPLCSDKKELKSFGQFNWVWLTNGGSATLSDQDECIYCGKRFNRKDKVGKQKHVDGNE